MLCCPQTDHCSEVPPTIVRRFHWPLFGGSTDRCSEVPLYCLFHNISSVLQSTFYPFFHDHVLLGVCVPTVDDDVTTYTTLIADVQEVHDDSSDFELPDTVIAWVQSAHVETETNMFI